ncbi:helix-turn-helix transcriptional regulator [Streptomyces sp. NPDC090075]|uniref:helix-turn-helix transcriptional regulator n=1 Tax=Streptomyces sp. NPDC090075 TaxID=3365937 RepID=UPI0038272D6D
MSPGSELGAFLRAHRDRVRPEDVGVSAHGRRRVPGLRREEVARLAGLSAQYYLRLEQGRDHHPSAQVLDALARALDLDAEATAYLHDLATPVRTTPAHHGEHVRDGIRQFVLSRTDVPAVVMNRYQDVLVANSLAAALSPVNLPGGNALRAVFLDPAVRAMYDGDDQAWERVAATMVAGIRALAGPESRDRRLAELVGELSLHSAEFSRLWARHEVATCPGGRVVLTHPRVGRMELNYEKLAISGTRGQQLLLFHAAPDDESARSLGLLADLAHSGPSPATSLKETRC